MKLDRVRQMSLDEVLCRSRQQAWKWLERTQRTRSPGRVHSEVDFDRFRAVGPSRFFAGATSPDVPLLVGERWPDLAREIEAEAEALIDGRFNLLGYRALRFGEPIDWHLDPVSGTRAPLVHWSLLNPLDFAQVGDSKVTWELNRHQWMVRLSQAFRLTGDERYADAVAERLLHWIQSNPRGV